MLTLVVLLLLSRFIFLFSLLSLLDCSAFFCCASSAFFLRSCSVAVVLQRFQVFAEVFLREEPVRCGLWWEFAEPCHLGCWKENSDTFVERSSPLEKKPPYPSFARHSHSSGKHILLRRKGVWKIGRRSSGRRRDREHFRAPSNERRLSPQTRLSRFADEEGATLRCHHSPTRSRSSSPVTGSPVLCSVRAVALVRCPVRIQRLRYRTKLHAHSVPKLARLCVFLHVTCNGGGCEYREP
jgi:hypothetical protein